MQGSIIGIRHRGDDAARDTRAGRAEFRRARGRAGEMSDLYRRARVVVFIQRDSFRAASTRRRSGILAHHAGDAGIFLGFFPAVMADVLGSALRFLLPWSTASAACFLASEAALTALLAAFLSAFVAAFAPAMISFSAALAAFSAALRAAFSSLISAGVLAGMGLG